MSRNNSEDTLIGLTRFISEIKAETVWLTDTETVWLTDKHRRRQYDSLTGIDRDTVWLTDRQRQRDSMDHSQAQTQTVWLTDRQTDSLTQSLYDSLTGKDRETVWITLRHSQRLMKGGFNLEYRNRSYFFVFLLLISYPYLLDADKIGLYHYHL